MRQEVTRSNVNVLFLHNHSFTQNVTTAYFVANNENKKGDPQFEIFTPQKWGLPTGFEIDS